MPFDSVWCCHPLDFRSRGLTTCPMCKCECLEVASMRKHVFHVTRDRKQWFWDRFGHGWDLELCWRLSFKKQASVCHLNQLGAVTHWIFAQEVSLLVQCVNVNVYKLHLWGSTFFMSQEIENSDFGIDLVMGGTLSFVEGCPLKSRRLYAIWLSWVLSPTAVLLKRSHHLSSV